MTFIITARVHCKSYDNNNVVTVILLIPVVLLQNDFPVSSNDCDKKC